MARITVTGATGLIGSKLVAKLKQRGDEVTVLSRDPDAAQRKLGVEAVAWSPTQEQAPEAALAGRDAVVHLAGEPLAQRWSAEVKRRLHASRVQGTGNLVNGLREAYPRPRALISSSAVGYYGPHADEPLDESSPAGNDFLAELCVEWEQAADAATALGLRVVRVRNGVVLDRLTGALKQMLPPFKAGLGGPVAGGRQVMSWIHIDDVVGIMTAAIDGADWSGPVNATAPVPVSNAEFSRALGRALRRPAVVPVPAFALRLLYGEMADVVTTGQRALPRRALALGYGFRHPALHQALRAALA